MDDREASRHGADAIYRSLVDSLFSTAGSLIAAAAASVVLSGVCWMRSMDPWFVASAGLLAATSAVRLVIHLMYVKAKGDRALDTWSRRASRSWELAYVVGTLTWSAALSLASVKAALSGDEVETLFGTAVVIGICGGTAPRNASRPWIVLAQIATILIPLSLGLWAEGSPWLKGLVVLLACLAMSVRSSSLWINRLVVGAMTKAADFEAALANMSQGLCMIDGRRAVLVSNANFSAIVGSEAPRGVRLSECCPDVAEDVESLLADGARTETRRRIGDRVVEVRVDNSRGDAVVVMVEDVTRREAAERHVRHLASHDRLTDLPNAECVAEEVDRAREEAARDGGAFSVLYIDLDKFKDVNDTLGHPVGDALLQVVAKRLCAVVRRADVVGRIGGDEFLILAHGDDAPALAARIREALARPFRIGENEIRIGASIGIAPGGDGADAVELRRRADLALYVAKADADHAPCVYTHAMGEAARVRTAMAADLRDAISDGDLVLHFQPIVDVVERRVKCCEALVRWSRRMPDGTRSMVRPDVFIGLAEETGLIVPLGAAVLRKACEAALSWPGDVRVAVNVSALQMIGDTLRRQVTDALAATGLPAQRLEIEITESQSMADMGGAARIMREMRELGVRIALDDFGTGRSSLAYLHELDFAKVKVDRSFMRAALEHGNAKALVKMIADFTTSTEKALVVEGVEREEELDVMRGLGVRQIQGYLFSKPVPADEVVAAMRRIEGAPALKLIDGGRAA